MTDALRDFVEMVVLSVEGASEARCVWQDDPGEHLWVLRRRGEHLQVEVAAAASCFRPPDAPRRIVFSSEQSPLRVARIVASTVQALHDELGPLAYEEQSGFPFPAPQLERLRLAIGHDGRRPRRPTDRRSASRPVSRRTVVGDPVLEVPPVAD